MSTLRSNREKSSGFFSILFRALFCGLLLCAAGCASSSVSTSQTPFTVLTYNIHHGEGIDDKIDIPRIVAIIKEQHADIVCLQEVDRGTKRLAGRDILVELADQTDMAYAFGRTIDFQGGVYGIGILTKFPILEERQTLFHESSRGEQRGVLQVLLDIRGTEILIMNTHLDDQREKEQIAAAAEIKNIVEKYTGRPVLLCGDMNAVPESQPIVRLKDTFDDAWNLLGKEDGKTFPSDTPKVTIDYMMCLKRSGVMPVSMNVLTSNASDHCPVVGKFLLKQ
jgi:endonuclease/exonuclease/phosphatase family metal-dependent hydrolase